MSHQTCYDCCIVDAPTKGCWNCRLVRSSVEEDINRVAGGSYDRWLEVQVIQFIEAVAATSVHQDFSVPIRNVDIVARAGAQITTN